MKMPIHKKEAILFSKLVHMGDRRWGGYLTTTEFIDIYWTGEAKMNAHDVAKAFCRQIVGISNPQLLYFEVKPNSELEKKLTVLQK